MQCFGERKISTGMDPRKILGSSWDLNPVNSDLKPDAHTIRAPDPCIEERKIGYLQQHNLEVLVESNCYFLSHGSI